MIQEWRKRYTTILTIVDAAVVLWAMSGALFIRFGAALGGNPVSGNAESYLMITILLSSIWWTLLGINGSRDATVLGYGTEEYKRVLSSSFWLFGILAVVSYAFQLDLARGYVLVALPAGVVSLFAARALVRTVLKTERRQGQSTSTIVLIGGPQGVEHLARALRSQPMAGYRPLAAFVPGTSVDARLTADSTLPLLSVRPESDSLIAAIMAARPDAVALSSGVPLPPKAIRELGWALADMNIKMIMAPALTDIAGPRIHTQPVAGLPLIHVSTPNLGREQRVLKRTFDLCGAVGLLLVLWPLLLFVAALIRLDSPGPVIFRQTRVGALGKQFEMYKFRSMVVDAEQKLDALKEQSEGNGVLFKLKADPRITRVGGFLRKYSLDELPQLFNVLNGTMSLVGPRPPLPSEVEKYQSHVHRRLMVRPGLTGLWQVSGRSLLSWDDSVRLDLYYVENWSLSGDIAILLKTVRAVLGRHGAY